MERLLTSPKVTPGMAFRCVPYSWRICIRLAYRNIVFSCCIKRTLKSGEAVAFLVCMEHHWGAGRFHTFWGRAGREGLAAALLLSGAWVSLSLPCLYPIDLPPPAPLPQVDTLDRVRAFPMLGPRPGEIVSTLGHMLA